MKPVRTYEITVEGYPPMNYVARSPARARVRCWQEYTIADQRCTFGEFLRIAKLRVVPNEPGTGVRIKVGGELATQVIVRPSGQYVAFMRDDGEEILLSHPNDVEPAPPEPRISIDIACNDPDNGLFAGRAEQINIKDADGELIEFECRRVRAPKIIEVAGGIRVAGKFWPTHGSKEWVGNWCWNAYWVDVDVAIAFLSWLHTRAFFDLTCGENRIFDRWKEREPFAQTDEAFIRDLLTKPTLAPASEAA